MVMGLSTVPRNIARLEYSAVRLPLTLLEDHVVARYWDDEAVLRLGFERFLGSLDGIAGRLLADDDLARRGQALILRGEYVAMAEELAASAQARRAEEELQAEQATARRAREQADAEMNANVAAAVQQEQDEKRQARRAAAAQARAKKAGAERAARRRAAQAGKAKSTSSASPARRRPSGRAAGS
jgi:selenophosphate synthetase-related protein